MTLPGEDRRFRHFTAALLIVAVVTAAGCSGAVRKGAPGKGISPADSSGLKSGGLFVKWMAADVLRSIKKSGLEAEQVTEGLITGPPGSKDNIIFMIPSFGEKTGGLISGFSEEQELLDAWVYLLGMNVNRPRPAWRIYRRDNILLLISGFVPEEAAERYNTALMEMTSD